MKNIKKPIVIATMIAVPLMVPLTVNAAETENVTETVDRQEMRENRREHIFEGLAEFLGITTDEVKALHEEDKRVPEILEEYDKTVEDFHQFMLEKLRAKLTEKVTSGELTQTEADEIINHAEERQERREKIRADVEAKIASGELSQDEVRDYIRENYPRPEGEGRGDRMGMRDKRQEEGDMR